MFAERLVKFMEVVIDLDSKRTKAQFWFPGRISKVKENLTGSEFKGSAGLSMGTADDPTTFTSRSEISLESTVMDSVHSVHETEKDIVTKKSENSFSLRFSFTHLLQSERRNPDSFPPTTVFGRFWIRLTAFARFFKTPEGIFSLRLAVVSTALWVPSVCTSSAWLYYEQKGLWALIMAQVSFVIDPH